ncbi:hypothetical protein L6R49_31330 [Myxococcota bacterium]|nr:hypothetical protein [Myxococcota bacterium]
MSSTTPAHAGKTGSSPRLALEAQRHAGLRWIGAAAFAFALPGLALAVGLWVTGGATGGLVMLGVATTGLSLGTFGLHNDTALALMHRAEPQSLDDAARAELAAEPDPRALAALAPMPRLALGVTVIALGLHALLATRLLGALGG